MKRYEAGSQITTLEEFMQFYKKKTPVFLRNKYLNFGFYQHWPLAQIETSIKAGVIYEVEKIKNGNEKNNTGKY